MNQFPQTIYRLIQLDKWKHMKTSKKISKFILGEQPGNFREKIPLEELLIHSTSVLIDSTQRAEYLKNSKILRFSIWGSNWQFACKSYHEHAPFYHSIHFRNADCFNLTTSIEKLPSHHFMN
jgi:hypothetical protein